MSNIREIVNNYLYFGIVFAIVLVGIVVAALIISKNEVKSIYLKGLLMELTNVQVLALSLIILNFMLSVYALVMKFELTTAFCIVSIALILLAFTLLKKPKEIAINTLISMVNVGIIYVANLVNELRINNDSTSYLILQILVNFFGIMFYIFATCKYINNIRGKGEINGKNQKAIK